MKGGIFVERLFCGRKESYYVCVKGRMMPKKKKYIYSKEDKSNSNSRQRKGKVEFMSLEDSVDEKNLITIV